MFIFKTFDTFKSLISLLILFKVYIIILLRHLLRIFLTSREILLAFISLVASYTKSICVMLSICISLFKAGEFYKICLYPEKRGVFRQSPRPNLI